MVHQLTWHFQGVLSLKLYNTISYNYNAIHIQIQYVNFNTFTQTYKLKSTEISGHNTFGSLKSKKIYNNRWTS